MHEEQRTDENTSTRHEHRTTARAAILLYVLLFASAVAACAGDVLDHDEASPPDSASSDESLDVHHEAILGGTEGAALPRDPIIGITPNPPSGAVEVIIEMKSGRGRCSGVMLGDSMVLTAAHCIDGGMTSGYFDGRVQLALSGRSWRCLTGAPENSNGKCRESRPIWFERYHSDDLPPSGSDLMILFPENFGTAWSGAVAHLSARRVWTGAMGFDGSLERWMVLFGAGVATSSGDDSGTMRYAVFVAPSARPDASSFSFKGPNDFRPCAGDSGGPFQDATQGWGSMQGAVLGLHVSHTRNRTECTGAGQKANATKMTRAKMEWINAMRDANGVAHCSEVNPNEWWCP